LIAWWQISKPVVPALGTVGLLAGRSSLVTWSERRDGRDKHARRLQFAFSTLFETRAVPCSEFLSYYSMQRF